MAKNPISTLGVVGLGNMGNGIATNLSRAGFKTLVWDVKEPARKSLEEVTVVATPKEMASKCSIIFFVVPGSSEVSTILKGRDGVLANARRGLVIYDLTTSDPSKTIFLSKQAQKKEVSYLDAGMTGGASGADNGTLNLMVGGNESVFRRTRRFLDPFTNNLFYIGPSGSGHTMKVIFNMVVHSNFMLICEAGLIAEQAGIPLKDMINVINSGNARNYASERRFPDHILSETWDARSRIFNLDKDVGMAVALAKSLNLPVSIGESTHNYIQKAVKAGMSDEDFSLLYKKFRKLNTAS